MTELIVYSLLFVAVMGHCLLANKMYKAVHLNQNLKIKEKNDWKLKALVFPGFFWFQYQKRKQA